jgi:hypothetical protein
MAHGTNIARPGGVQARGASPTQKPFTSTGTELLVMDPFPSANGEPQHSTRPLVTIAQTVLNS